MNAFANALERYEASIAAGRQAELTAAAERLEELIGQSGAQNDVVLLIAAWLHLRTLGALNGPDCPRIEDYLHQIGQLAAQSDLPMVGAVRCIITYCSYYSSNDPARISQAISLFASRGADPRFPRLETACLINEVLAHKIALELDLPSLSVDRVEALVEELRSGDLPARFSRILDATIAEFYHRLTLRYQDLRFLRQGMRLIEPGTRSADQGIADAALAGVWTLASHGLEHDPEFEIAREWIRTAQARLRAYRPTAKRECDMDLARLAHCMGLWARFDYERHGRRTGVLRALSYFRIAASRPHYVYALATTMRVAFEAGLGEQYLDQSLATFEAARANPASPPGHSDNANYASTLMLMGTHRRDADALARAIELYENAIASQPRSGINISRLINVASAARHIVGLRGGEDPFQDAECAALLERGFDAVIQASILDRTGSTHEKLSRSNLAAYLALFEHRLGRRGGLEHALQRSLELMSGLEEVWPVGFVLFVADRLGDAAGCDDIDCDLLRRAARALAKAKFMLQVIDLCDGGDRYTGRAIDALFRAATAVLAAHLTQARDAEGLAAFDLLTGGFVRRATQLDAMTVDERATEVIGKAMSGYGLDPREVALIRRSPIGSMFVERTEILPEISASGVVLLDLIAVGSDFVALRRDVNGLAARLLTVTDVGSPRTPGDIATEAAGFAGDATVPLWISFRNVAPAHSHVLFRHIRAAIEGAAPDRLVLQRSGRTLDFAMPDASLDREKARILIAHSPKNEAPPLQFGFQLAERLRTVTNVVELALNDCGRTQIARHLPDADLVIVLSHGQRAQGDDPDRILLAGEESVTAEWLLSLGPALAGKWVFLVACNSGHFNARLTHDDIGFGALVVALGARGSFVTLHSVDELAMVLLLFRAIGAWDVECGLPTAIAVARRELLGLDEAGFLQLYRAFIGGGMAARAAYRSLDPDLSESERTTANRRVDIDAGWSMLSACES